MDNPSTSTFSIEDERKELMVLAERLANPPSYDEFASVTTDSSLKRVTTLIRKLKNISSEPMPQLLKEVEQVNLKMHFSEVCASILENRPKNSAEYLRIVRVIIHVMIVSDTELRQMFYRELLRNISNLFQAGIDPSDKNSFSTFRSFFRLACELQIVKAADNKFNVLSSVLSKLLTQDENKASEFIPFVVYLLKNFKGYLPYPFESGDLLFEKIYESIVAFFKTMCRFSLRLFSRYKNLESRSKTFYELKGDLTSDFENDLLSSYSDFKDIKEALKGLAELLFLTLPKYENEEPQFIVDDNKVIFTSKIDINADIYQDDEERDFYEKLPEFAIDAIEEFNLPEEWKSSEEIEEIYKDEVDPDAVGKQSIKDRLPKGMEQFFKQVEGILSIADADRLSEKINAAGKDLRIEPYFEMFFVVARTKNELVKYIARIHACIKHTHPTLIQSMIASMCGQFHFLTKRKEPLLGTRRRICSFLGEFAKFKLLPQSIAFNCMKKCVRDFTGPNIEMTCFLLEQCGRFLYLKPESHARVKNLIEKIGNFRKNSLLIPNDKNIMLGYAIFCVTRVQTVNFVLEPDFMETFLTFAFGQLKSVQEFVDLFRSIHNRPENVSDIKTMQLLIAQVTGLERNNYDNLVCALNEVKSTNHEFVYKTIDLVICECISDLKRFDPFNFQEVLKRCLLLGKLYYWKLIESDVFFGYLYQSITIGHGISENFFEDGPEDLSRCRLILTLLASLKDLRFNPSFYYLIREFLAMLRCYLSSKIELSKEIHELCVDVYKAFDDVVLEPLKLDLAIEQFSTYQVFNLFNGKLDYLVMKDASHSEEDDIIAATKALEKQKLDQELLELDKEMAKIIGHGLETRKLDRHQPQSSDVHLPFSGLIQRQNGGVTDNGAPKILLKKKKKAVIKTLNK